MNVIDRQHATRATATSARRRTTALRELIATRELSFVMEAHSALAARIVEEAGFAAIWASGLSISASLGLRDSNEASWTQLLDVLEYMADATTIPILVDGDTGYGNFNNVRRLVRKLEQRGIAGVCIEDKLFPKTNSFVGENQPLASIEEFCGKLRAGCDARADADFQIIARCEALISGHGMDEALARCIAYREAGADAILIHSKRRNASEILEFAERWGDRCPLVIVPTTYHATPTEHFRRAGISTVIWANHLVRASITAMRETAERIVQDQGLHEVEGRVATVAEIFRLTGNAELEEAQLRYLPAASATNAIVLAAARGAALADITGEQPKCMLDVRGQPLLRRLVTSLRESGIRDVTVVRGWRKEAIALSDVAVVDNDRFATTGEVASLEVALDALHGETVISYGDILFRRYILDGLLASEGDIVLAVDTSAAWHDRRTANPTDRVWADRVPSRHHLPCDPMQLRSIATPPSPDETPHAEWIGLMRVTATGAERVRSAIRAMRDDGSVDQAGMHDLIARLQEGGPVTLHCISGHWIDVDDLQDLADARNFT